MEEKFVICTTNIFYDRDFSSLKEVKKYLSENQVGPYAVEYYVDGKCVGSFNAFEEDELESAVNKTHMKSKTNKKYRVYIDEFQGCMGHYKKSYIECASLEEAKQKAKEIEEADNSHWTTCYAQEGEDKTFTVTRTIWKNIDE